MKLQSRETILSIVKEGMVKKIALVLLILIGATMIASAQESELYVTTLYIEKIYPTSLGYRIDYRRPSSLLLATSYLSLDWFGSPDSIGKLVYAQDNAVPFINIYWRGTEIDHFVLYVHRSINDLSWGSLASTEGLADRFSIDTPEFQF